MKRRICFWHGEDKKLRAKLLDMSEIHEGNSGELFYTGYLDDFEAMYKDAFMILADGTLCVTHYRRFTQRR